MQSVRLLGRQPRDDVSGGVVSTTIIGLAGGAGAGKTTVAKYLVEHYGALRYAFADPLKVLVQRIFRFPEESLYGTQEQKERVVPDIGWSGRQAMQRVGTQGMREVFGEDVWVDHTIRRIRADAPAIAVIEDVRFLNEGRAIRHLDGRLDDFVPWARGFVWRLEPPGREEVTSTDASHQSEAEWMRMPVDYVIRPEARGLEEYFSLVRRAAAFFSLTGTESCV